MKKILMRTKFSNKKNKKIFKRNSKQKLKKNKEY